MSNTASVNQKYRLWHGAIWTGRKLQQGKQSVVWPNGTSVHYGRLLRYSTVKLLAARQAGVCGFLSICCHIHASAFLLCPCFHALCLCNLCLHKHTRLHTSRVCSHLLGMNFGFSESLKLLWLPYLCTPCFSTCSKSWNLMKLTECYKPDRFTRDNSPLARLQNHTVYSQIHSNASGFFFFFLSLTNYLRLSTDAKLQRAH